MQEASFTIIIIVMCLGKTGWQVYQAIAAKDISRIKASLLFFSITAALSAWLLWFGYKKG